MVAEPPSRGIKKPDSARVRLFRSRGGRIRTYGLVVPNDARYRAALHPENDAKPMGRLRVGKFQIKKVGLKKPPTRRSKAFSWGKLAPRSEWQDSNLRPPAPHAGAIPGYATPRLVLERQR